MLVLLTVLLATAYAAPDPRVLQNALMSPRALHSLFTSYSEKQGRVYAPAEKRVRLGLFRNAVKDILSHNNEEHSWTMGINKFADMTDEEMYSYTGANFTAAQGDAPAPAWRAPLTAGLTASSKDWRGKAVTKVKDQSSCGSCWVFSAVGALEGAYKNKGSILKSFSEQEGLECSQRNGCDGGWMPRVYDYVKRSGRLAPMRDVKYRAREGSCRYSRVRNGMVAFKITGYTNAAGERANEQALSSQGPLSVAFTCTRKFFKYDGGIYTERSCSGGGHAVTAVGYTSSYFIIKNSWGRGFGVRGYVNFARGNTCGINNYGFIPTLSATGQTDTDPDESDGGDDDDDDDDDDGDTCTDSNSRCPEWAARSPSECTENWRWMTDNCRKSCQQCSCVDLGAKCEEWKGKGYCEHTYTTYMSRLCKKTCGKCSDDGDDDNNGDCQKGFKKCPDGSCVHEHWNCDN